MKGALQIGSKLFRSFESFDEGIDTPGATAMQVDDHITFSDQGGNSCRQAVGVRAGFVAWEYAVQVNRVWGIDPGIATFDLGGERIGSKDDAQASFELRKRTLAQHFDRQSRPGSFVAVSAGDERRANATCTGFAIVKRDVLGGGVGGNRDFVPF